MSGVVINGYTLSQSHHCAHETTEPITGKHDNNGSANRKKFLLGGIMPLYLTSYVVTYGN